MALGDYSIHGFKTVRETREGGSEGSISSIINKRGYSTKMPGIHDTRHDNYLITAIGNEKKKTKQKTLGNTNVKYKLNLWKAGKSVVIEGSKSGFQ